MHPLNAGEMEFVFRSVCQKRKIGRVIECAGLEIRYTHCGYRGFESLIFRFSFSKNEGQVFVSCREGCMLQATEKAFMLFIRHLFCTYNIFHTFAR